MIWMISFVMNKSDERDLLRSHLVSRGIETRPLFFPVNTMPMYNSEGLFFPNAEYLASRGINLPSWPELSDLQIKYICDAVISFFEP